MKKIFFFLLIIFLFWFSYLFKNFQLLLLSLSLSTLFALYFPKINKNLVILIFFSLFSITGVEMVLKAINSDQVLNFKNTYVSQDQGTLPLVRNSMQRNTARLRRPYVLVCKICMFDKFKKVIRANASNMTHRIARSISSLILEKI